MTGGAEADGLDVKILRLLIQGETPYVLDPGFRKSIRAIARKVGVDEHTVRSRIKAFHEAGFVQEWRTILNPNLRGAVVTAVWVEGPPGIKREETLEKLKLLPGVYLLHFFLGGWFLVVFLAPNETSAQQRLELLGRLADSEAYLVARIPFPPCEVGLSDSDRRILMSIYRSPRKRYVSISKEVGLSTRTVKSRIERLTREGALFAFPALNPKGARDSVLGQLVVTYPTERKLEIDARMGDLLSPHLWHIMHTRPITTEGVVPCAFDLMLPNVATAVELLEQAQQVNGVDTARMGFSEEIVTIYEPLEALIKESFA